jgi:hypothetical protein
MEPRASVRYSFTRGRAQSVVNSLVAALALGALVGAIALVAQAAADGAAMSAHYPAAKHESVTMHAFAMMGLGAVAVAVAVALCRLGWVLLAVPVLLGVAFGPMTIVAAPVRSTLINAEGSNTVTSWHLAVGAVVLAFLSAWAWWMVRCLDPVPVARRASSYAGWPLALFAASFLAAVAVHQQLPEQVNAPVGSGVVGWELLAAGTVVAVAVAVTARAAVWFVLGVGAALGLIALAYTRPGGWPGVAGWEAIQPPIITCWVSTATVLVAPIAGLLARPLRNLRLVTVPDALVD